MDDWQVVVGSCGYEVSSEGEVRRGNRVLKPFPGRGDYLLIGINWHNGTRSRELVHRLVMAAFSGPCPNGQEVCHENGVRTDNRFSNLRYGTRKENMADQYRHRTRVRGRKSPHGKLCFGQVEAIRTRRSRGEGVRSLGRAFGVSHTSIQAILNGKTWTFRSVKVEV